MNNPVEATTKKVTGANEWLNREPFVVSALTYNAFHRIKKRFLCQLCGINLLAGSKARWIYANGTPGIGTGNFFVCGDCDGTDETVLDKARESYALAVKLAKQWNIYGPDWERK